MLSLENWIPDSGLLDFDVFSGSTGKTDGDGDQLCFDVPGISFQFSNSEMVTLNKNRKLVR